MPLSQDLSYAFRQLLRHRVYALTAIASMALGIGATAAVYSVLYGVLIDPYPYRDAKRLAFVTIRTKQGRGEIPFTVAEADQLQKQIWQVAGAHGQSETVKAAPVDQAGASSLLENNERRLVSDALAKAGWNQSEAARLLRIGRDALRYKMKKYGLEEPGSS